MSHLSLSPPPPPPPRSHTHRLQGGNMKVNSPSFHNLFLDNIAWILVKFMLLHKQMTLTPMYFYFGCQDNQVSWNTTDPDLTPCFQKTVISWLPVAFLLLLAPIKLYSLCHLKDRAIKLNWLNCSKMVMESFKFRWLIDLSDQTTDTESKNNANCLSISRQIMQSLSKRLSIICTFQLCTFWFHLCNLQIFFFKMYAWQWT